MLSKKKKISRKSWLGAAIFLGIFAFTLLPANSFAAKCGETETFFDWECDSSNTIPSLFVTILNWVAAGVIVVVIGSVIYGSIMYSSSGGNPSQAKQAIGIIRNAVIALILFASMYTILNFLVPGGMFT